MYFKDNNNQVFWYDDDQMDLVGDKVQMTDEEISSHLNPVKTAEQIQAEQIAEANAYLQETDWVASKFTDIVIVRQDMTEAEYIAKYADIFAKRTEARQIING